MNDNIDKLDENTYKSKINFISSHNSPEEIDRCIKELNPKIIKTIQTESGRKVIPDEKISITSNSIKDINNDLTFNISIEQIYKIKN